MAARTGWTGNTATWRARALAIAAVATAGAWAATPSASAAGSADRLVAAGPGGTAHVAFVDNGPGGFGQVFARTVAADGALGDAQAVTFAYRHADYHSIGVDQTGDAVLTWTEGASADRVVRARRVSADGGLGPVQPLTPAGTWSTAPVLAVEPDGDAIAVWTRQVASKLLVEGRRLDADGTLGPTLRLSPVGGEAFSPDVAVAPDGTAIVTWARYRSSTDQFAQARVLAADGTLGPALRLGASSSGIQDPTVAVDAAGGAVVAWQRRTPTGTWVLESRARQADGALRTVQSIGTVGSEPVQMAVAGDPGGRTAYAWVQDQGEDGGPLKARVRLRNGGLGPAFDVTATAVRRPRAAFDPSGNATFAWETVASKPAVELRRRTVTGALGPVRTLSAAGVHSTLPSLAVDEEGKATVVWDAFPSGDILARTVTSAGVVSPAVVIDG